MNQVFPRVGHLIPTHRGWGILCHTDSMWRDKPWQRQGSIDALEAKDTRFVADWLKSKGLHKLCSVFEVIQEPFVLSSACKSVV